MIHPNIGVRDREKSEHIIRCQGMRPYLAIEGDWRLIEPSLLRVPDVRRDDLFEG